MFHLVIRAEFLCTLLFTELSTLSYITFLKKKKIDKNFNLLSYNDTVYFKVQSKNTLFTGLLHFI